MRQRGPNDRILATARRLRHDSTPAERKLWRLLRDRSFAGFKFRRQHPIGPFVLDFYCARAKLAVEVDGGGHVEPAQVEYDAQRTKWLAERGVTVVRFWNDDVTARTAMVQRAIWEALQGRTPSPATPSPALRAPSPARGRGHKRQS